MKKYAILAAAAAWLLAPAVASALDTVKLLKGGTVNGRITKMSPTEVEVEGAGGITKPVPVNEIEVVFWDDEPSGLKTARQALREGNYLSALEALKRVTETTPNPRPPVAQDIAFYSAFAKAQMALGGLGDIQAVGREMAGFVTNNKGSYHWLEANEVVGDLLVASGVYDRAVEYYTPLAATTWPDYKMRAAVAIGRSLLAQKEVAKAQAEFDKVLAMNVEGELAAAQRLAAQLGKARCLAATQKTDEAIKMIEAMIAKADPEQQKLLLAQAYNALGTAYRAADKNKEALMAFLHVHLIYHNDPDAHAEALANLVPLWTKDNKPERAQQCASLLEQRYPNSRWNKKS